MHVEVGRWILKNSTKNLNANRLNTIASFDFSMDLFMDESVAELELV